MVLPALTMVLGAGGDPPRLENRALGFERLDRDGNGYLTRKEAWGFGPESLLERADTDGDGRLDKGELLRFMQGLPRRRG
jgi:Ca2+-binding EF-hand superfamily protein